jgi:OPT oligopeptide transporter protein
MLVAEEERVEVFSSDEIDAIKADALLADKHTFAITPQDNDPNTPAFTFRAVLLGCIWAVFLAYVNVLFSFRANSFSIPTGLAQLLSYPMGIALAWIVLWPNADPKKLEIP